MSDSSGMLPEELVNRVTGILSASELRVIRRLDQIALDVRTVRDKAHDLSNYVMGVEGKINETMEMVETLEARLDTLEIDLRELRASLVPEPTDGRRD